jgi:hypothetical protein
MDQVRYFLPFRANYTRFWLFYMCTHWQIFLLCLVTRLVNFIFIQLSSVECPKIEVHIFSYVVHSFLGIFLQFELKMNQSNVCSKGFICLYNKLTKTCNHMFVLFRNQMFFVEIKKLNDLVDKAY